MFASSGTIHGTFLKSVRANIFNIIHYVNVSFSLQLCVSWALILWKLDQCFKEAKIQNNFKRVLEHKRNIKMNTILSKLIRIHMKIDMIIVDKSGPEAKIKILFILCKSVFAEEIGLNWLIRSSFGCAVLLRKLLDFHKSGRRKRQIQIALFVCESFCIKNWFNLVHGVFWVRCTVEKTADFLDKTGRLRS